MLLFIALFSMGAGHGTYFFSRLFYPIPMMIAEMNDEITDSSIHLAIIQIPFYGLLLFIFRKYKWKIIGLFIICIHLILVMITMSTSSGFE